MVASADHVRTSELWPGLDYEAFPDTVEEWLDALTADDTGTIDCVAPFLRPYVAKELTSDGRLKAIVEPWRTPLSLARFQFAFDMQAPKVPWSGSGVSASDVRAYREAEARKVREERARQALVADLHREAGPYVYFIGGDVGAIKIGFSKAPKERLAGLQIGSPVPLRIMAAFVGSMADEAALHERFSDYRLHGEWFDRHPKILAEIERLRAAS